MYHDWSNIDVERKQKWTTKCWLNSFHRDAFPTANGNDFSRLVDEFEEYLSTTDKAFKHDRTTTVKPLKLASNSYVLKRYNARSAWHKIKRALRASRAQRCWCMSFHFQRAGLNVAEPVMVLEDRFGPVTKHAYLVNALLNGQELLTLLPSMSAGEQIIVKEAVTEAFKQLREHRISHGDMKASNLLWVDQKLFFIDLDAAQKHRSKLSWQLANKKDRKRFLKNWQAHPELLALFSTLV